MGQPLRLHLERRDPGRDKEPASGARWGGRYMCEALKYCVHQYTRMFVKGDTAFVKTRLIN